MQKRGQAAMEFLMTYGWALLVVLIAIGALAFFGVLNPSKFLPQQCILGPGLACEDFKINAANQRVYIKVRNGLGRTLEQFQIHIDNLKGNNKCGGYYGYAAIKVGPLDVSFLDGSAKDLEELLSSNKGIPCGGTDNAAYCCMFFSTSNPIISFPYNLCQGTTHCGQQGGAPPLITGEKFSEDIIITYKEQGSQIVHQRIGKLTAQIE